jgi:hypothetical protein
MSTDKKIIKAYTDLGSMNAVGRKFKICPKTVRKVLVKHGILDGDKKAPSKGTVQDDPKVIKTVLESFSRLNNISAVANETGHSRGFVSMVIKKATRNTVVDPDTHIHPAQIKKTKRYVITSALNNCDIDKGFLAAIRTFNAKHDGQLLVVPVHYKNVSLYQGDYDHWWPSELDGSYVRSDVVLCDNLKLMGSMRIQATASSPLRSMVGVSEQFSAVFGHPKVAMETIPTPMGMHPSIHITTGSISLPSYSETKAGRLGQFHHSLSALLIETDGHLFWWRHLKWCAKRNSFIDLGYEYFADGRIEMAPPAEALILGDTHVGFHDPAVTDTILGQLTESIRPKNIVLHDLLDMFSGSHHHMNNKVLQVMKEQRNRNSVYDELIGVAEFLTHYLKPEIQYHVVSSNHHDHLDKWLNNSSNLINTKNLWLWHYLNAEQLAEAIKFANTYDENDPNAWESTSAFEIAMRKLLPDHISALLRFHSEREPLLFFDIDCSNHGHRGPNGSRGSKAAFSRVQYKTFIGHSHTPGINGPCYQLGMTCRTDLPYLGGYSSHMAVSGLIYGNGKRTLFPVIKGKHRL